MASWLSDFREDLRAVRQNEPSLQSDLEALLCHTPLHAVAAYRLAHRILARFGLRTLARLVSNLAHWWSGVEIHPAARIGRRFFIDHGTGVVIGETAEVGDDCILFHNVTLGGTGKHRGKRHPTLGNDVLVGTGATLLGPIRVGDGAKVGAGAFIRMRDVPAGCTAVGVPARIAKRDGRRVDEELPATKLSKESIPVAIAAEG
ncbi:MAG: serine O-acetyltransferase EpsC [Myxococcota bacterium]